tara:strand:+ start:5153 stop:5422 length:270 start_codon:yes stop_codon:yes gene_type:complete
MSWKNTIKKEDEYELVPSSYEDASFSYQKKLNSIRDDVRGNPMHKLLDLLGAFETGTYTDMEYKIVEDIDKLKFKIIDSLQDRIDNLER